jgi:mannose-6-phosphate isomerase-like protein (cupin superfamily)
MKRVVTGHDGAGKAVFAAVGPPPEYSPEIEPGANYKFIWALQGGASIPADVREPIWSTYFPRPHGSRFLIVTFPPASAGDVQNINAGLIEFEKHLPGALSYFENLDSGMHTTPTVDYGVVLSGSIALELDNGVEVEMGPGDCLVQNGTRHAWHNRTPEPCVIAFVTIGAESVSTGDARNSATAT